MHLPRLAAVLAIPALAGLASSGCNRAEDTTACEPLMAAMAEGTTLADETDATVRAAVQAAIDGGVKGGQDDCDVDQIWLRGTEVITPDELATYSPGSVRTLRGHVEYGDIVVNACSAHPPENIAQSQADIEAQMEVVQTTHDLVLVESERVDPVLNGDGTFEAGRLVVDAYVYRYSDGAIVCHGVVESTNRDVVSTSSQRRNIDSLQSNLEEMVVLGVDDALRAIED